MKKISFVLIVGLFLVHATALAADFGGIGGRPSTPNPDYPHSKEWFIYQMKPGETKQDAITIENNDDHENTIEIYPADSTPSTDGGFALKQKVESREKIGKWITLSKNQVTLKAHTSEIVPFTVVVPNDPKIDVGEHTGGILIQKINQESQQGGLTLLTRVGVRVYLTIPGEVIKKLEITKFTVDFNAEKKVYTASLTIKNSGNVSQELVVKMKVASLYGWLNSIPWLKDLYQEFPLENTRNLQVLRDDSLTSNFEFKKPFFGKFNVDGWVEYDQGAQTINAQSLELNVGLDMNVLILLILIMAFLIFLLAFLVVRKMENKEHKKKKRKKTGKAS